MNDFSIVEKIAVTDKDGNQRIIEVLCRNNISAQWIDRQPSYASADDVRFRISDTETLVLEHGQDCFIIPATGEVLTAKR